MNSKNRMSFKEIVEKVDTLIDMADDKSLIDSYRTTDLLEMVEEEFERITIALISLPDIEIRKDK